MTYEWDGKSLKGIIPIGYENITGKPTDAPPWHDPVTLTCEICGRTYQEDHDPKKITEWNYRAIRYYCCSLECERASWDPDFVPLKDD